MKRREFIAISGCAAANAVLSLLPYSARAQGSKTYRVAFLSPGTFAAGTNPGKTAEQVVRELAKSGITQGVNLEVIKLQAEGHFDRLPQLVTELLNLKPDVIVTLSYPAAWATAQGTHTVPVVIFNGGDPVKTGLVASLNRPGGNVTGISDVAAELAPKRLEILKESIPDLRRVAMLWNAKDLGMTTRFEASAAVAKRLGIVVQSLGVGEPEDFGDAFVAMERERPDGLLMVADALTFLNRKKVFDFAAEHKLPAIYETDSFVRDGGLMSYGPDSVESAERGASLVARILKGEKPANLPLEQPTRFRLVINLKTARTLDLAFPATLLARADEVIE
jgi:putative tryptophan/tyrosine transport system substrate-binding protein